MIPLCDINHWPTQPCFYMLWSVFRWLRLLSRRERSGVSVGGHQSVRHHQTEDQRVVSRQPIGSLSSHFPMAIFEAWRGEDKVQACAANTGWICGHEYKTERVEWHGVVWGKKGRKKTRNITWRCSLSAVVVHPTDMMSAALSEQPVLSSSSLFSLSLSEWTSPLLWKSSKITSLNWNPICEN